MGDGVDFWDLDLYSDGIPHDVFARLRRDEPVAWNAASEAGTGFWSLTRYGDVARANRDHEGLFVARARDHDVRHPDAREP